jgi:hypothetical protein
MPTAERIGLHFIRILMELPYVRLHLDFLLIP